MKKTATLLLAALLAVSTASALAIEPGTNTTDIEPGSYQNVSFTIVDANSTVQVSDTSTEGGLEMTPDFLENNFTQGDTVHFNVYAPEDLGEGQYRVLASFTSEQESASSNITTVYEREMLKLDTFNVTEDDWLRFPEQGFRVKIYQSDSENFSLQDTCHTPSTSCSFTKNGNDYRLESEGNKSLAVYSTLNQSIIQGYDLIDLEFSTESFERGQEYGFRTVNQRTGEEVPYTRVKFNSTNFSYDNRNGENALDKLRIPYDLEDSEIEYELVNTQADVEKEILEMGSGSISLTNFSDYVAEREVNLKNLPGKIAGGETITAEVTNSIGNYENYRIKASYSQGTFYTDVRSDGSFDFTLPKDVEGNQTLELQAVNTETSKEEFQSQKLSLNIIGDGDGDGVINTQDECKEEPGLKALNGCQRQSITPILYEYDPDSGTIGSEVDTWNLKPDTAYYLVVENSNGETVDEDVSIQLVDSSENSSQTIDSEQAIFFEDAGGHSLKYSGSTKYTSFNQQVLVEESGGFPIGEAAVLFFVLVGGIFIVIWKNKSTSGAVRYIKDVSPLHDVEGEKVNTDSER